MRRRIIFLTALVSAFITVPFSAMAQRSSVRVIPLNGHFLCGGISPDGQSVVLYENGIVQNDEVIPDLLPLQLVDVESGNVTLLQGPTDYVSSSAFNPDGNRLATYHSNGYIYLWDVGKSTIFDTGANTQPVKQIPALPGSSYIQFMPDGRTLINRAAGTLPQFLLWDTETGVITSLLAQREASFGEYKQKYLAEGMPDSAASFAVSPDGKSIVIGSFYDDVWLWSTTNEDKRAVWDADVDKPKLSIRGIYFMPDGKHVVYAQREEEAIYVLDLETGTQTATIPSTTTGVFALAHDGQQVAWVDRGQQALYVARIDQPNEPRVIPLPADYSIRELPTCSVIGFTADDTQVVFSGFDAIDSGQSALYVIDVP